MRGRTRRVVVATLLAVAAAATVSAGSAWAQGAGVAPGKTALTDTQKAAVTDEVLKTVRAMLDASAKMVPDVSKFVWDTSDCRFLMPDGKVYTCGDFEKVWAEFRSQFSAQRFTVRSEKVIVLGSDDALYSWQGAVDMVRNDGVVLTQDPYCGTYLLRKVDGEWRMAYGQESGLPPVVGKTEAVTPKK